MDNNPVEIEQQNENETHVEGLTLDEAKSIRVGKVIEYKSSKTGRKTTFSNFPKGTLVEVTGQTLFYGVQNGTLKKPTEKELKKFFEDQVP